jgi:hypothetical protein
MAALDGTELGVALHTALSASAWLCYEGGMIVASQRAGVRRVPQLWTGLLLLTIFWPLNWILPDATRRTSYLFFPLWLGYILTVDGLVLIRTGTSILWRSRIHFWWNFLVSAPAWWLFEVINWRTRNWQYLGGEVFTSAEYMLLSSLSFSTVMPAVFETSELVRTFQWTDRFTNGPVVSGNRRVAAGLLAAGWVMLALAVRWPRGFYPLVWGAVFLVLEPLNLLTGRKTFFDWLGQGDWRPVVCLSTGALICGFFWEMWNYYSYPKWIYHTPGAEFCHVFEMPLPGYIGYLPFAWELFALRNFLWPQAPALRLG